MMSARPDTLEGGFRPLQIYEQVAEKIRDEIRAGRYAAESRLPSERELAALFQVGRPAVREALGALQNEGLVFTKRNSGTYVVAAPLDVLARRGDAHAASEADFSP
ncbi:winged helix-turn-helix domain-containing protein, partial [Burkholderia cenocepacia]